MNDLNLEVFCRVCTERDFRVNWMIGEDHYTVRCVACGDVTLLPPEGLPKDTWRLPKAVWEALPV